MLPKIRGIRLWRALAALGVIASGWLAPGNGPAWAAVNSDDAAELFLVVWDPVREASYTKDLGVTADSFFATGQQDGGYQNFWSLTPSDTALAQLLALNTPVASLRWGVFALDRQGNVNPGELRSFLTLEQGVAAGQSNANYDAMVAWTNADWQTAQLNLALALISELNNNTSANPYNFHAQGGGVGDWAWNGSGFTPKGQSGYFDKDGVSAPTFGNGMGANITNAVGKSSWFYYVTNSSAGDAFAPVTVDEFDNLAADGYWGLAQNPADNNLVLSYTLSSALASGQAATPAGRARASLTELRSGALTRLVATPQGEFAEWCPPVVSAVPEPAAWWSLCAGGLALWLARRRRPAKKGQ